jgi:hypothetical protein
LKEDIASLTVESFMGKANCQLATLLLTQWFAAGGCRSPRGVIPEATAFTFRPTAEPVHCVGRGSAPMPSTSPRRSAKDGLREHQEFSPSLQVVVVGRRRQGADEHLPPEIAGSHWDMAKRADLPGLDVIQRW